MIEPGPQPEPPRPQEAFDRKDIKLELLDDGDPIVTKPTDTGERRRLSTVEQNAEIIHALTERARTMLTTILSKRAIGQPLTEDEEALYRILNRIDR